MTHLHESREKNEDDGLPMNEAMKPVDKKHTWEDDCHEAGIPVHMRGTRFARPMCPRHGWIRMNKRHNRFVCSLCGFVVTIDKKHWEETFKERFEQYEREYRIRWGLDG